MGDRLDVIDEIFLRTHRGLGTPIVMQGLWRTDERLPRALLATVHEQLRRGPLGKRVVRVRIPGARHRWRADHSAHPLSYSEAAIPPHDMLAWADRQGADLDPSREVGWRLTATPVQTGGTLVSLTCSHVLADARGLSIAVDHALRGMSTPFRGTESSDLADAGRIWAHLLRNTRPSDKAPKAQLPQNTWAGRAPERTAIVDIDAQGWEAASRAASATPNSLFVALVTAILRDATGASGPVTVSLPVDVRDGDSVGNAMSMSETVVEADDTPAVIRRRCAQAYTESAGAPDGIPPQWLHVFPDRLAHAATRAAAERDVLCSNIGTLPTSLRQLGAVPASGVAARALHPRLDAAALAGSRTRLSGYLCRSGAVYTLSLAALDAAFSDDAHLRDLALALLRDWDVPAASWT